jgi:hypothetical protein
LGRLDRREHFRVVVAVERLAQRASMAALAAQAALVSKYP